MRKGRRDCIKWVAAFGFAGLSGPGRAAAQAAPKPAAKAPTVLVVGDSLSAEYGLQRGRGWVALLGERIDKERIAATVVNASISGDTTAGGRARLAPLLAQHKPSVVVIELGGNDGLRGLPLDASIANLTAMTRAAKAGGAQVVLVAMQVPPNYGRKYSDDFAGMYDKVGKAEGAHVTPFLLKGIADVAEAESLFQPDRIHPREVAQPTMLANVWPVLRPLLG